MAIKNHTRHTNDAYYTNPMLVKALLGRPFMQSFHPRSVLEPMVGKGDILTHVLAKYPDCQPNAISNDIEKDVYSDQTYTLDALDENAAFWAHKYHLVISNPAFSDAHRLLPIAWESTERYMIMLLRLSFIEPAKNRRGIWEDMGQHLRYFIPVNPRPRFIPGSNTTDSVTHAWFVFDRANKWGNGVMGSGVDNPFQFIIDWR